ncbi:MAG: hypothetical protein K1X56_08820 [Flavobacteriales bacterium]|nr:hypothetical protein [Flavobacteriales bacterium]
MRLPIFIFLSLLLFSCKKDKLDNEAQLLIGRWKLVESGGINYSPDDEEYFELEFSESGKIKKWKDGKCKERGYFKKITVDGNYLDAGYIFFNVEAKSSSPFEDEGFCDRLSTCEIILANSFYNPKMVDMLSVRLINAMSYYGTFEKIGD